MLYILIILFGLTILYISITSRIEAFIKLLAIQGFLLFLMMSLDFGKLSLLNYVFLALETLGFKTIFMPIFLINIIKKNEIYREIEPYIPRLYSLITATLIFAFGFYLSYWSFMESKEIKPIYFGVAISTILSGLFIITSRKKIISHILGYMTMENGIFLLSLSLAKEMPLIVNLGVLLDVFLAIFLFGMFLNRIQEIYKEGYADSLSDLKD